MIATGQKTWDLGRLATSATTAEIVDRVNDLMAMIGQVNDRVDRAASQVNRTIVDLDADLDRLRKAVNATPKPRQTTNEDAPKQKALSEARRQRIADLERAAQMVLAVHQAGIELQEADRAVLSKVLDSLAKLAED